MAHLSQSVSHLADLASLISVPEFVKDQLVNRVGAVPYLVAALNRGPEDDEMNRLRTKVAWALEALSVKGDTNSP